MSMQSVSGWSAIVAGGCAVFADAVVGFLGADLADADFWDGEDLVALITPAL